MTVVRANARLAGLDTGELADVDLSLPLWANRVKNELVTVLDDNPPPPSDDESDEQPDEQDPLAALVDSLNAEETIDLADFGGYPPDRVRAAEQAGRARKTVLAALDRLCEGADDG